MTISDIQRIHASASSAQQAQIEAMWKQVGLGRFPSA
jgi:hypothetical protein